MPAVPRNHAEALKLADEARDLANARRERARMLESAHRAHQRKHLRMRWWQFWRPAGSPLTIPFDKAVDRRVANDPEYKGAVSDNKFYLQYSIAYAQREILAELRKLDTYINLGR